MQQPLLIHSVHWRKPGNLLLLHPPEHHFITVVSVISGTVYTADGSGGSTGFFRNLKISFMVFQHRSHLKTLG